MSNTGVITAFKIISETGVAAGVRRIEALTAKGLMNYYSELEEKLHRAAKLLKASPDKLEEKITHVLAENKELRGGSGELKEQACQGRHGRCD